MVKTGHRMWLAHPHVTTGAGLSFGERAADVLKRAMGTWSALGVATGAIAAYWAGWADPGHLRLNLALSLVAAVQGIVLQIALNRGDRISAELAQHTYANGQKLLAINEAQSQTLEQIHALQRQIAQLTPDPPPAP